MLFAKLHIFLGFPTQSTKNIFGHDEKALEAPLGNQCFIFCRRYLFSLPS